MSKGKAYLTIEKIDFWIVALLLAAINLVISSFMSAPIETILYNTGIFLCPILLLRIVAR